MKARLLLLALLTTPLLAADVSKILLSGATVSIEDAKVTGTAKAIVGDMTISADVITFERQSDVLKCEGAVTIRVSGSVVTARDCAIQLNPGDKKLFFLSRGAIQLSPPGYFPMAPTDLVGRPSDREALIREFRTRTFAPEPSETLEPMPMSDARRGKQ